ncbi:MAG: glycosyltransferase family 39 protein [Thermoanaerobaculia bacterium]
MSSVPAARAPAATGRLSHAAAQKAIAAVAVLFFVKAATLALFVTPLWDVPDESGHLAYVLDLADGRGLPVYGRTPLPPEVLARWDARGSAVPAFNWVAQHPPLSHAIAAPFALAARGATSDREARLRAPRLASVLAATLALIVLFQVLREATDDAAFALAGAACVSFVPMYSHLASGTHNEPLLALAGSLAGLGWVRLVRSGALEDAFRTAAALGLAGATKLTALPVAAGLLILMPLYLTRQKGWRKGVTWLLAAAIALAAPAFWLLRNWLTAGHPLVYAAPEAFSPGRLAQLLAREPVFDHTFKNFLGLIGWMGGGQLRWFQISGLFLGAYLAAGLLVVSAAAVWLWRDSGRLGTPFRTMLRLLCVAAVVAGLLPALSGGPSHPAKHAFYALVLAIPFFGLALFFGRGDRERELIRSSLWVVLVFLGAYLWNVWRGLAIYGHMRAVHGRYFLAILPFLMLGFGYPAARLFPRTRARDAALIGLVLLLAAAEIAFFLVRVVPFYRAAPG